MLAVVVVRRAAVTECLPAIQAAAAAAVETAAWAATVAVAMAAVVMAVDTAHGSVPTGSR